MKESGKKEKSMEKVILGRIEDVYIGLRHSKVG